MNIVAFVRSCPGREQLLARTLTDFQQTDWLEQPVLMIDDGVDGTPISRHRLFFRRLLRKSLSKSYDFGLFLEDDLQFNRFLRYNLCSWHPLNTTDSDNHFFGSIYNPAVEFHTSMPCPAYAHGDPNYAFGAQGLVISRTTALYLLTCWGVEQEEHADLRLIRLAARVCSITYHIPSLVQHLGRVSTWDGPFTQSADYEQNWRRASIEPTLDGDKRSFDDGVP